LDGGLHLDPELCPQIPAQLLPGPSGNTSAPPGIRCRPDLNILEGGLPEICVDLVDSGGNLLQLREPLKFWVLKGSLK
jgi:hypothetical protein